MLKSLAPQTAKIVIRKRHVYRCLLFTVFCILYLCLRHLRSHPAEPVTDALPSPIKPNPLSKNRKIPSLSDAFNEALLESSQNPITRLDFVDTRRYTPNLSNVAKLNVKYLSGSMQKDVTAVDAAEEDDIADTESEIIDDREQAEDQSLEVSEQEENGEGNDETGEEPEDAEVNDSKEEVQSSSPQSSRTFSVSYKLTHNIDAMADAAGLSKEIMMEMLKARLPSEAFKATGVRSFNSEKWKGDPEYLFKDNLPTCLGKPCSRSEYINVKQNMTTISTSQFMSPYYHAVDISKLTYVPPSTLLTSCRIHLCQNKDCENITQTVIPAPPQEKTRLRRLNHILGHFKNLTSPTHCIRALAPLQHLYHHTNFTPYPDGTIGEKLKRARFIGNDICKVFNASKADELHYVGIHQCPKARQMIVPLPKASPIAVAPTLIKKRKKGKKNAAQKEVEYVYPTLTVRYIKMDRFRYHQFHNPILIAIREGWVTSQGVVVNKDGAVIHFEGSCQSSDVDPTVFFKNEKLSAVFEVFVASTPSDKASLPHWHFVTTLPRIAPYLEELRAHPHIAIHYTSLGGSRQFLSSIFRFLNLKNPLISGPLNANTLYIPEPQLHCSTPSEYSLHMLRTHISHQLPPLPQTDILVIQPSSAKYRLKNHNELVRMLSKEFRGYSVVSIMDGDALPPAHVTLAHFARARVIISVEGAGLGYVVSTPFGASVVEVLTQPIERRGWNMAYSSLVRGLGVTWYGLVLPLLPKGREVNLVEMHGIVDAILKDIK